MGEIYEKPHRLPREAYGGELVVSFALLVERRQPAFTELKLVQTLVEMLQGSANRFSCLVPVYCFMPDHLHLIVVGRSPKADLWRMIVDYKQTSGFWFGRNLSHVSWQKGFYDHVVRKNEDLVAQVRYLLDNPCRRGLTDNWEDYPFKGSIGYKLEDVLAGLPL